MIITKTICLGEREIEISICADDIMAVLAEESEDNRPSTALRGLNRVAAFIRAITDETIKGMTPSQRAVIADFLKKQSERYL